MKQKSGYLNTIAGQTFWGLYPALVVANLIPALSGIINGLLVGNAFSPASMAAVSFALPVTRLIGAAAILLSSGAGIAYGRYLGRGQSENLHKVYTSDVLALVVIGLLLTVIGEIFAAPIAQLAGAAGESFSETVVYLRGLFIGIIPMMLMPSLVTFLNLGNEAKYAMLSSLLLAVCNLLLGFLNVNYLHMGMFGMGLSSSLSQYFAAAFLLIKFIRRPELGHLVMDVSVGQEIACMAKLGSPSAVIELCVAIRNMTINSMTLVAGGTLAVAGLGIMNSASGFFCAVIPAMGSATATMASINVGEEDRASMFSLTRYLLKTGAAIYIGTGMAFFASAPLLAKAFGVAEEGFGLAVSCIHLYSFEFLTSWFTGVVLGMYQSLGRSVLANVANLLNCFVYPVAVIFTAAVILPEGMKVYGVWSCYGIASLMGTITLIVISWIKTGHFPYRVEYLLWLDHSFGVKSDDRMTITIRNMDEVVKISEKVQSFCISRGIDRSRSMRAAICIEEMAGNIVSIGFRECGGKKNLVVDIYLAIKNDEIFIRIKDNASEYDSFQKLDMYEEDDNDPVKNFGIRMIAKLAKDMKYQTTLGMNVLTMTV